MSGNYNTQTMVITSDGSQHIYEDIDLQAPPKLAPSGVYTKVRLKLTKLILLYHLSQNAHLSHCNFLCFNNFYNPHLLSLIMFTEEKCNLV